MTTLLGPLQRTFVLEALEAFCLSSSFLTKLGLDCNKEHLKVIIIGEVAFLNLEIDHMLDVFKLKIET